MLCPPGMQPVYRGHVRYDASFKLSLAAAVLDDW